MKEKKRGSTLIEKRNRKGYLYLLPWIIGFLVFQLYPQLQCPFTIHLQIIALALSII